MLRAQLWKSAAKARLWHLQMFGPLAKDAEDWSLFDTRLAGFCHDNLWLAAGGRSTNPIGIRSVFLCLLGVVDSGVELRDNRRQVNVALDRRACLLSEALELWYAGFPLFCYCLFRGQSAPASLRDCA